MTEEKRGIISIDELHLPPAPALAPQIAWGDDFNNFDKDGQIRYLKKLASALNHACDLMQHERNDAYKEVIKMEKQVENAEKQVEIQKTIVRNALEGFNTEKQTLIRRVQELETDLKNTTIQLKSTESRLKKYED